MLGSLLATAPTFTYSEIVDPATIVASVKDNAGSALLLALGLTAGFILVKKVFRWCFSRV